MSIERCKCCSKMLDTDVLDNVYDFDGDTPMCENCQEEQSKKCQMCGKEMEPHDSRMCDDCLDYELNGVYQNEYAEERSVYLQSVL